MILFGFHGILVDIFHGVAMLVIPIIFQIILFSLAVTFACIPLGIWTAKRAGLIDYPGAAQHKHHSRPTPMAGGIILVLAFVINGSHYGAWDIPFVIATFMAGLVIFSFGIWDDLREIKPSFKLFGQILAVLILMRAGIFVQIFESLEFNIPFPLALARWLDILITFIWVVGITNAFNFIDSMDGLAVGIGGVAAGFFMLLALDAGQSDLAGFSASLAAMCMGIYFFNVRPARFFLGDAGAQVLGFWLASLAIAYRPPDLDQMSSWFATILLLGVPIFDLILVVISRLRRKRPIYQSARDHTYHRLRNFGLEPNRVVLLIHLAAFVLSCLAIIGIYQTPLVANLIFGLVVLCGFGILLVLEIFFEQDLQNPESEIE